MENSLRNVILLMLLVFSQYSLGGIVRQTSSNRLLDNKTPQPIISNDNYYPQVVLMPDETVVLQNSDAQDIDVLSNDQFTGYNLDVSTLAILVSPLFGIATLSTLGNQVNYEPDSNFNGWDSFTYSICDFGTLNQAPQCSQAEVRVFVIPFLAGPTAVDDTALLSDAPGSVIINVLNNDYDSDGPFANWASLEIVVQPDHGIATVTQDYNIQYQPVWQPNERFVGFDTIYYRICDDVIPTLCDYAAATVQVDQVCVSCKTCSDLSRGFEDHLQSIQSVFRSEVLSM